MSHSERHAAYLTLTLTGVPPPPLPPTLAVGVGPTVGVGVSPTPGNHEVVLDQDTELQKWGTGPENVPLSTGLRGDVRPSETLYVTVAEKTAESSNLVDTVCIDCSSMCGSGDLTTTPSSL